MYRHILIPTDGSELAEHAVTNGLSLAKSLGAKVTVIIVEEPYPSYWHGFAGHGALEELANLTVQIKKHAASVLDRVANAAKQAGMSCDTIQVADAQPHQAIIATAAVSPLVTTISAARLGPAVANNNAAMRARMSIPHHRKTRRSRYSRPDLRGVPRSGDLALHIFLPAAVLGSSALARAICTPEQMFGGV